MKITDVFLDNYDVFVDTHREISERIDAFKQIIDLICNMNSASDYLVAILNAVLDECDRGLTDEDRVCMYLEEMVKCLKIRRGADILVCVSEENDISDTLRDHSENVTIMPYWSFVPEYMDSYDYFIQCGKTGFSEDIPQDRLINLYDICNYQMCINPSAYAIASNYQRRIKDADTIVTGMSYARNAIRSEYYTRNIVSLANSSQDLYYDYLGFKNAISINHSITNLIIGLAPYSLRYDLSKTAFDYRLFYYMGILSECDPHNNIELREELNRYKYRIGRFVEIFGDEIMDRLFDNIVDHNRIEELEHRQQAFTPDKVSDNDRYEIYKKFLKPYEETLEENKKLLAEYIEYAISEGVLVYLFIPPFTGWYKENWNRDYVDELLEYIDELTGIYPVVLINMISEELPDHYFGDYAHLNDLGAMYVSTKISKILK